MASIWAVSAHPGVSGYRAILQALKKSYSNSLLPSIFGFLLGGKKTSHKCSLPDVKFYLLS
jgi:hypothetical protein